ncbi:hypothetical protein [Nocardioides sp. LML1-1-1.1]|uniref:hypothetical protein n=2 Tax=Nocardioides TaxID=1839 RepID=UPI0034325A9A
MPTPTVTYCTVLATNYLPKALALAESLERQMGARLVVLLIDAETSTDHDLPADLPIRLLGTDFLGLDRRELLGMTTRYELVEFATAIKPVLFKRLLEETEQVFYLDPDTYVTEPMEELSGELQASEGGILLTSHFLHPLPPGAPVNEGHQVMVGIYNLGFGGWDRRAIEALDWWWERLRWECIVDALNGLFVDQKWMDIGADLFRARALRHHGYNVSVMNVHERPLAQDEKGYAIVGKDERLRLFHFHAFDPQRPELMSVRWSESPVHSLTEDSTIRALAEEYAAAVLACSEKLPPAPAYRYNHDTAGKRIPRLIRRAWRVQARAGADLPLPFLPEEAEAWKAWKRAAWKTVGRELGGDAAKGARITLVDEFVYVKERFPRLVSGVRGKMVGKSGIWG